MKTSPQDLFAQAHELPAADREKFLRDACGDNAELHLEVQRLLVDAARADSFFGDGDGATLGAKDFKETYAERDGDVVGPYKLRQQIGEGGFGTVWMAEQSVPLARMVALKVIKAGMDTKQVLARFEAERQALAIMDHPNIAKVLDAGATAAGRPWFAMELVKGIPITDYCDQAGLGTKERLALFRDVCAAINHAHQKGVIHRDIKPSNVMVTLHGDKPVVKVIDFGIAKATQGKLTDKTLFTRFEQFIGTPVYMSPEQASLSGLDIDTRSDIYALGILLYELLVGKPPFDAKSLVSAGYEEMRRIIREVEPPKPSSRLSTVVGDERSLLAKSHRIEPEKLNRLVEPDLDWIVMKAIDKDRARRYETANAFAMDIRRFLSDEPVLATPPGAGYQFRKFARHNKAALRVAAGIAAVLVAATAVSTWQAVRATRAEALAAQETERTEAALEDAEATSKFLTDMFGRSQPGTKEGGREVKVVEVLDPAVAALEADDAIPPARRAKLQTTLGSTYFALGLPFQAIPLQEKARDHYLGTSGPEDAETLKVLHALANSYHEAGRRDEALTLREEVLAMRRKILGLENPDTLHALGNLAISYNEGGRRDDALKLFEEVLGLLRKVRGPEHSDTLMAIHHLAKSYFEAGRLAEALTLREEVLALRRKVNGLENPDTLLAMGALAISYHEADRRHEALKMFEEVLTLRRKVSGPEHPDTLNAMANVANSYHETGRPDEALKMGEEVLALRRTLSGPKHPDTLNAMNNLAYSYRGADRLDAALRMGEEVLALRREVSGPEHPDTLWTMANLAIYFHEAGRRDEALKLFEEGVALRRKVSGRGHPDTLNAMNDLAISYLTEGRIEDALALLTEASIDKPEDTSVALKLAALQVWFGKGAEHAATSRRLLEWAKKTTIPDDLVRVAKLTCLTQIPEAATQKAVLVLARKALDLRKPGQPPSLWAHLALGMAEYRSGHHQEAITALNAVRDSLAADTPNAAAIQNAASFYCAMSLFQRGTKDEARALFTATEAKMKPFPTDEKNPLAGEETDDDDLILWLACKEAKALLAESPEEP